jgi:hypothetical protein
MSTEPTVSNSGRNPPRMPGERARYDDPAALPVKSSVATPINTDEE